MTTLLTPQQAALIRRTVTAHLSDDEHARAAKWFTRAQIEPRVLLHRTGYGSTMNHEEMENKR